MKFGENSTAYAHGYTLELLTSWLEDIAQHESDRRHTKKRGQQIELLEGAIQNLNQILDLDEVIEPSQKKYQMWSDKSIIGKKVSCGGQIRTVIGIYNDIRGGVILDKPVDGLKSWNLGELTIKK